MTMMSGRPISPPIGRVVEFACNTTKCVSRTVRSNSPANGTRSLPSTMQKLLIPLMLGWMASTNSNLMCTHRAGRLTRSCWKRTLGSSRSCRRPSADREVDRLGGQAPPRGKTTGRTVSQAGLRRQPRRRSPVASPVGGMDRMLIAASRRELTRPTTCRCRPPARIAAEHI